MNLKLLEFLEQSYYRVKVPLFEWKEQRWVSQQFYFDPIFKALDQELLSGPNPYSIARIFPYGETPIRALFQIAQAIDLKPTDRWVDLGCGRGRTVFFLSHFFGCEAVGIDLTSAFIRRAQRLAKAHQQERVFFYCQDFLSYDFSQASCVYLYGTTYSQKTFHALEERLRDLPLGSCVITVSQALSHTEMERVYPLSRVHFPWGEGELFFHKKISNTMPMFVLEPPHRPRTGDR